MHQMVMFDINKRVLSVVTKGGATKGMSVASNTSKDEGGRATCVAKVGLVTHSVRG